MYFKVWYHFGNHLTLFNVYPKVTPHRFNDVHKFLYRIDHVGKGLRVNPKNELFNSLSPTLYIQHKDKIHVVIYLTYLMVGGGGGCWKCFRPLRTFLKGTKTYSITQFLICLLPRFLSVIEHRRHSSFHYTIRKFFCSFLRLTSPHSQVSSLIGYLQPTSVWLYS